MSRAVALAAVAVVVAGCYDFDALSRDWPGPDGFPRDTVTTAGPDTPDTARTVDADPPLRDLGDLARDFAATLDQAVPRDQGPTRDLLPTQDLAPAPPDATVRPDLMLACGTSLANIGGADFTIAFDVVSTAKTQQVLLNQRAVCANSQSFWAIGFSAAGVVTAEVSDGGQAYVQASSTSAVNDGGAHHVELRRVRSTLTLILDQRTEWTGTSTAALGALPPLQIGMETACNVSSASAAITNVCVAS